ncbi:MAG: glycoside hydrolase, partial [Actinomycetota bacterium]|nr:glycoside hydrolase [Actinomycetota bacterium]
MAAALLLQSHAEASGHHINVSHLNKIQKRLLSGTLASALEAQSPGADGAPDTRPSSFPSVGGAAGSGLNYGPSASGKCSSTLGGNVKVNQNCLNVSDPTLQGRAQANNETFIAQDAFHPEHIVASDNNYIRGDGTCGAHFSLDGGKNWADSTVPNGFTYGFGDNARQYWQAGGDTSLAWDTRGNAYESCQLFNRGTVTSANPDQSSGFVVFRSTGNNGASWNFPGRYVSSFFDPSGTAGVLEDKQLIAVDNHVSSPFRDRIYVTWTEFTAEGTAYIWEAYSKDYGETFSHRVLVSADRSFCTNTYGFPTPHGSCNENQFSNPFVGPDGNLYVAYSNFNNRPTDGLDNHYQVLLAKSTDGGQSFSAPVKVSDYNDLPDCNRYQGEG